MALTPAERLIRKRFTNSVLKTARDLSIQRARTGNFPPPVRISCRSQTNERHRFKLYFTGQEYANAELLAKGELPASRRVSDIELILARHMMDNEERSTYDRPFPPETFRLREIHEKIDEIRSSCEDAEMDRGEMNVQAIEFAQQNEITSFLPEHRDGDIFALLQAEIMKEVFRLHELHRDRLGTEYPDILEVMGLGEN